MELTIQLDGRSKQAKALIALLKSLSFVKIKKEQQESTYNPEFVKKIKEAEERAEYTTLDMNDIWGSLGLK